MTFAAGSPAMTPLRQRFTQDLQLRNYAPRTASPLSLSPSTRPPDLLAACPPRCQQPPLLPQTSSGSPSTQPACPLRFLYCVPLRRKDVVEMVPYGKKVRSLPCVLSADEVARLF